MLKADFVKSFDMVIVEFVVDFAAGAAIFDNFSVTQNGKLVGDGGFGHIEDVGNVTDAHFALIECPENLNASGFAEDFEEFGKAL